MKPETASDKKLARAAIESRYTFLLIISQADDYGLLLAEPRQLLGLLYPHDEEMTSARLDRHLRELVDLKMLQWRMTVDGARVLQVVNWKKHQVVQKPGKPTLLNSLAAPGEEISVIPPTLNGQCLKIVGDVPENNSGGSLEKLGAERDRDRDRDREKGKVVRKGKPRPPNDSWVARWHAIWADTIGEMPFGRFATALKPIWEKYGDAATPWLATYCRFRPYQRVNGSFPSNPDESVKNLQFVTPEDFAKTIVFWRDYSEPAPV